MLVFNFHVKMHLRFGSKAADTGSYGQEMNMVISAKYTQNM